MNHKVRDSRSYKITYYLISVPLLLKKLRIKIWITVYIRELSYFFWRSLRAHPSVLRRGATDASRCLVATASPSSGCCAPAAGSTPPPLRPAGAYHGLIAADVANGKSLTATRNKTWNSLIYYNRVITWLCFCGIWFKRIRNVSFFTYW